MSEQQQYPTREQIAEAIAKAQNADYWIDEIREWNAREEWEREAHAEDEPFGAYEDRDHYLTLADAVLALFPQPTPSAEPTVQVPVALIEQAPHERTCASFSWNGVGWDHDDAVCDCWKTSLSRPESAEPVSIADMAPGTTFTGATRVPPSSTPDTPDRWTVLENGSAECARHGAVFTADEFDPSTIRDVTPPKDAA